MKRVSASDAKRLQRLEQELGSRTVRTILSQKDRGIMRTQRLSNLTAGTGKLSPGEQRSLRQLDANLPAVKRLQQKTTGDERQGKTRKDWKVNRSIKDWIQHGKARDADRTPGENEQKAIRGLRFLGIDPSERTYYIRKVKAA